MGTSIWRVAGTVAAVSLLAFACSGSSKQNNDTDNEPEVPDTVCDARERRCDGRNVKVCNADGTAETIEETCTSSQSCSNGACEENSCIPNTKFCKNSEVWKCDSRGAGSSLSQQCAAGLFCREEDDDASCSTQACSANQPLCDGSVATTCQIDGSGPKPGGTDCAANKQTCYEGVCRDIACTSGTKVCQHNNVYLCSQNGADMSLLAECGAGEVCDGAMGACRPKLCDPGRVDCDASRVVTCNEFGSGYLAGGEDCSSESKVCVGGTCKKQVCAPNSSFCQDGSIYSCDNNGTSSTLSQTCTPQWQHCVSYSGGHYAYCEPNQCQAGQVLCSNNSIVTCTAEGALPSTGTSCGEDKYCESGQCKPRGCVVEKHFCKDGNIFYCDRYGPAYLSQTCEGETVCKALTDGATCAVRPCVPAAPSCLGNKVGTCGTDGQTLSKVTEDCAATSTVCTAEPKCAKSAVDLLGVDENVQPFAAGQLLADAVEVSSARKVTEMHVNLVITKPRELRWVIFELTGNVYTARIDKIVSNVTGTGFVSSGALNYTVKPGKRYLFGVVISGGDGVTWVDTAPFMQDISFGKLVGGVMTYYTSTLDAGYIYPEQAYQMKVTTEFAAP